MTRRCPKCQQELPVEAFGFHRYGPDGRKSWCRDCIAVKRGNRRSPSPDRKRCPRCSRELELDRFGKHAGKKDGLESWCKDCVTDARVKKAKGPSKRTKISQADRDRRARWQQRAVQLERRAERAGLGLEDEDQLEIDYGDVV